MFFAAASAFGQTNQGVIAGNVLDSTGATVANTVVTAKNEQTGSTLYNKVDQRRHVSLSSIQLGRYTITANASGFKQSVSTGVEVCVETVTSLDIKFAIGGATESVTVAANAPLVETQSSDVGGTVTTRQILELPLAWWRGRDVLAGIVHLPDSRHGWSRYGK